ncbi:MAG: hypothetical protein P5681_13360 [Limnospira sp. PMC 894.15]|uniref:hypothetical protein n=1 Tax=unclassified Limnospira TaxID=2642885 RepID=UPI0028E0E194|nr:MULTISPECIES: hypothetical protein [unclassified Limnospira]MDT9188802.1 hypothetical protein [Limnospira sp. PMC 894.15]MDT9234461.1 hypothetical protein [Limnospira sp. PMC 917.15]
MVVIVRVGGGLHGEDSTAESLTLVSPCSTYGAVITEAGIENAQAATANENGTTESRAAAAIAAVAAAAAKAANAANAAAAAAKAAAAAANAAAAAKAANAAKAAAAATAAAAKGATAAAAKAAACAKAALAAKAAIATEAAIAAIIAVRTTKQPAAALAASITKHPAAAIAQCSYTTRPTLGSVVGKLSILNRDVPIVNEQRTPHSGTPATEATTATQGFTVGESQVVEVDRS